MVDGSERPEWQRTRIERLVHDVEGPQFEQLNDPEYIAAVSELTQLRAKRVESERKQAAPTDEECEHWLQQEESTLHESVGMSLGYHEQGTTWLMFGIILDDRNDKARYKTRMDRLHGAIQSGRLICPREGFVQPVEFCRWAIEDGHELPVALHTRVQELPSPLEPADPRFAELKDWNELRFDVSDNHTLAIRYRSRGYRITYQDMGMVDGRSGDPNRQWRTLIDLVEHRGRLYWNEIRDANRKVRIRLAQSLKNYFGLTEDPLLFTDDCLHAAFQVRELADINDLEIP